MCTSDIKDAKHVSAGNSSLMSKLLLEGHSCLSFLRYVSSLFPDQAFCFGTNLLPASAHIFVCLWSPCCSFPVHAEEEPSLQPTEGRHCVVHGELQRLRQRQVSGCKGSAQGLGAGRLCSECSVVALRDQLQL